MYELLIRLAIAVLAFIVIVLAIVLYAERYEKSKLKRENEQVKSYVKTAEKVNKNLQHQIEDLLDERKKDAIKLDIAKAMVESKGTMGPFNKKSNAIWGNSDNNNEREGNDND